MEDFSPKAQVKCYKLLNCFEMWWCYLACVLRFRQNSKVIPCCNVYRKTIEKMWLASYSFCKRSPILFLQIVRPLAMFFSDRQVIEWTILYFSGLRSMIFSAADFINIIHSLWNCIFMRSDTLLFARNFTATTPISTFFVINYSVFAGWINLDQFVWVISRCHDRLPDKSRQKSP